MPRRARAESEYDRDEPSLTARDAVEIVRENIAEIAGAEPVRITSVAPGDEGGWIVEVETVEDRRIPSSADMLALYEVELDADGEMLAYRRIRRYMRGQTDNGGAPE